MPTKTVSRDWWRYFLTDVLARFAGAPTTILVRDRHLEELELGLAYDLPLAGIELEWWPKERVRLTVTQLSGALQTVEIEEPQTISLLEAKGGADSPDNGMAFQIETAAQIYFVQFGVSAD